MSRRTNWPVILFWSAVIVADIALWVVLIGWIGRLFA